ncbi:unnamed protein product [Lathyrus oleraceus]
MEAARKYSVTVAFLLAFFIIASYMAIESEGRGVSERILQVCVTTTDCFSKHFPCPPDMVPFCIDGSCKCFHE